MKNVNQYISCLSSPIKSWFKLFSFFRGFCWSKFGRIIGLRIIAGKKLKLEGDVVFKGPGRLIIGDNVLLCGTRNSVCTPWTSSSQAVIEIGSNSFLNGTRLNCRENIIIGSDCIIGDARISDNDGHSISRNRRSISSNELETRKVIIEDNVWIGANVIILKGIIIGKNSVIGAGSVVTNNIPPNVVAAGNPCKFIKSILEEDSVLEK